MDRNLAGSIMRRARYKGNEMDVGAFPRLGGAGGPLSHPFLCVWQLL